MPDREPTNAELLAAAVAIALEGRNQIERTDRTSYRATCQTLDALHEHLAVAGGSLLVLADRLGCKEEVEQRLREGRDRLDAFRACQGLGGRA